jgi:hypothetical protein
MSGFGISAGRSLVEAERSLFEASGIKRWLKVPSSKL